MREPDLWKTMIDMVERYKSGEIRFPTLVNGLEGIMDNARGQSVQVVEKRYDMWGALEDAMR